MSRPKGWPWDDLYRAALRAGLADEVFWEISARAAVLLTRQEPDAQRGGHAHGRIVRR